MKRIVFAVAVSVVAVLLAQATASAHFLWATVQQGQVRFALLEHPGESPDPQFETYVAALTPRCEGKSIGLGSPQRGARYAALQPGQDVVTAESVVGARERAGEAYLLVYHAKAAASLAAAGKQTREAVELCALPEGDGLRVSVLQEGWPVPNREVWVQWPGDATPQSATTDIKGEARLARPATATASGFVGVRAMVSEKKSGTASGKAYSSIRRWATLTFPVPATVAEKSLSKQLRESFGNNHEVVGKALFNKILFEGKLTRPQLIEHLRQRALVHSELHRILKQAGAEKRIPYGDAQKQVLSLLFSDIVALDSTWPTEADAHPLTKAFLQEIRDSEKQGPYFALGVWHVYYGGITNGGRMIGQKIAETLSFSPSYYEKSDGYAEYLAEINKNTDPSVRQEMMRGGQAAYRYIIAISNETH